MPRVFETALAFCYFLSYPTNAPAATNTPPSNVGPNAISATNSVSAVLEKSEKSPWAFSAAVSTYIVRGGTEYAQPTLTANRNWLHLEARYNYEALQTGSAWIGCNFSGGNKLAWEMTPMLGAVFGDLTGVAPGYSGSLTWWKLGLYSEGEYVYDPGNSANNFFYNWSELWISPVDWFRIGLVAQRTRAYETDREIQRGLLAGFTYKAAALTTYVFNPDDGKPTVMVAVSLSF